MQLGLIVLVGAGVWVAVLMIALSLCEAAAVGDRAIGLIDESAALRPAESAELADANRELVALADTRP
jgi:hypothetical protein